MKKNLIIGWIIVFFCVAAANAENPAWWDNSQSIIEKTNNKMERIIWSENKRRKEFENSLEFQKLEKDYAISDSYNEVGIAIDKYVLAIKPSMPMTEQRNKEFCRVLNMKLQIYCLFADIMNNYVGDDESLEKSLEVYGLSVSQFLADKSKMKSLMPQDTVELKFVEWLTKNQKKQREIINRANSNDDERSFVSIFTDGVYSREVAKEAMDGFYAIVQDEIPYEWKMALIKWSKLLNNWNTTYKRFNKILKMANGNPDSDLKALSDLEIFLTNANEWFTAKDLISRSVLFDSPLYFYTNLAKFRCDYANAGLFDDSDMLQNAGVSFAKASPFIPYLVDNSIKEYIGQAKSCLKGSMSEQEYRQMTGWGKVNLHWFEKPKSLNVN